MTEHSQSTGLAADVELDVRKLRCPMPLLKMRQQLSGMQNGQLLLVRASDPGSWQDIPVYLRQACHDLVHSSQKEGEYLFWVRAIKNKNRRSE